MIDFPDNATELFFRPLVAIVCGAVLGLDREAANKPAGLRTMMMVALGSAGFTSVAFLLYDGITASDSGARIDPMRIIDGVAGGIGFLGAGTIIQSRGSVEGITTAATIWLVGAIGVACGVGQYLLAVILASYAWTILRVVGMLQRRMEPKEKQGGSRSASNEP